MTTFGTGGQQLIDVVGRIAQGRCINGADDLLPSLSERLQFLEETLPKDRLIIALVLGHDSCAPTETP